MYDLDQTAQVIPCYNLFEKCVFYLVAKLVAKVKLKLKKKKYKYSYRNWNLGAARALRGSRSPGLKVPYKYEL